MTTIERIETYQDPKECFLELFCYIKPIKKHGTFGGYGRMQKTIIYNDPLTLENKRTRSLVSFGIAFEDGLALEQGTPKTHRKTTVLHGQ